MALMLASAPVFHKLFEVREVTCTVTVPLDSRIPLSGGVHGKVPCVGSVAGDKWSGRQAGRALLVQGSNQAIPILPVLVESCPTCGMCYRGKSH